MIIDNIEKKYGPCEIRRPSKKADNQYTLIKTENHMFYALFKDGEGKEQEFQISEAVYLELLKQTREDDARLRWEKRHLDNSADVDTLPHGIVDVHCRIVEDAVITATLVDEDSSARNAVTEMQWRRLQLHYCLGLTFDKIAEMEGRSSTAIKQSVIKSIKKLKKIF